MRSAVFNAVMYASGLMFSLCGLALVRIAPGALLPLGRAWARVCLWALSTICGISVRIEGIENVPAGPAVIAAQHQSALDIFIWLAVLDRPAFVLKQELCAIPVFGRLLRPAGNIPVDREGAAPALRRMVAECRAALADGRQIVIFPEGTRVPPGERVALQPGVVALAKGLAVPVVPAATDTGRFWRPKGQGKQPGAAHLRIAPPLDAALRRPDLLAALADVFYN
jgi:1-acyl-sn-glycerol-3-phosphate acyltransferase